uniref:Large ribosomal subunit protein mL43 n=1 Tax=Globodera rostochiensis TaxID=31243 RepID=A0A914GTE6_GLORO
MPAIPRVDRLKNIFSSAKALNFAFRLSATNPIVPSFNGVSAYQPQLQRITIKFCKQTESSVGMRNYIEHSLTKFATENPHCAIYVVPGKCVTPVLRAEYANGRQVHVNALNFSMERVCLHMNNLRTRSGLPIVKIENPHLSHHKSVQGMWTPSKRRDTRQNLHLLPNPQFSTHLSNESTATKYVLDNSVTSGGTE